MRKACEDYIGQFLSSNYKFGDVLICYENAKGCYKLI